MIRAFNRDTPFPRFVLEQLAGDTLDDPVHRRIRSTADWLTQAATGFLVGGTHDIVGNQTIEGMLQQRADDLDDMITATGTTFLGLTIQCARCHDHKFDPIAQKDYYGFQAIFAGVNHAERDGPRARCRGAPARGGGGRGRAGRDRIDASMQTEPLARPGRDAAGSPDGQPAAQRRAVRAGGGPDGPPDDPGDQRPDRAVPRRARGLFAATPASPPPGTSRWPRRGQGVGVVRVPGRGDPQDRAPERRPPGNGRSWISRVPGKGSVTIAWPEPATIDRVVWGRDREEAYRDRLATEYYVEAALEPGAWQVVASSLDRVPYGADAQAARTAVGRASTRPSRPTSRADARLLKRQAELRARLAELGTTMKVYAGTFSQPGRPTCCVRGDPTQKGPEVAPAGVAAVGPALVARPAIARGERAGGAGALDRRPGQSAAGAGDGQPGLALPLRPGDRRHAQRLRLQRRAAVASRAARLAGGGLHRRRLAAQADPSADRHVGDLSPVEPARREGRRPSTATTGCSGG